MKLHSDPKEIVRALRILFQAGDVVEMRVPKTEREGTVSGYFSDYDALAKALASRNGDPGIYVTINPCSPSLLARCANRIKSRARTTTSDKDIARRRWLLVDVDATRPAEISSTDREHEAALERARDIRLALSEEAWPAPVLADSGNGGHLLYAVDLPNDDASTKLVEAVLKALAARFNDASVKVDETVFNAARITKAYGTMVRKGDDVPERPHRLSRIIDAPAHVEAVSRELLEEIVRRGKSLAQMPTTSMASESSDFRSRFDIDAFVARHLQARAPVAHEGGRKWVLEECPFNEEHKAPDAAIFQKADDSLGFKCFHNSCAGKTWRDVREKFEGPRPSENRPAGKPRSTGRPEPPKEVAYSELIERKTEVGEMLFEGYPLPAHGCTLKFGPSRGGKTVLAIQELLAVASGKPLFDYYRVLKPGAVMIVEMDDPAGADAIAPIVQRFASKSELPIHTFDKLPFGFGPQMIDWLRERIAQWSLRLIVLDSYTALRGPRPPGIDIVKQEQFELNQLDALGKDLKTAIEVIHHDSTGKAARGLEWTLGAAGTFAMGMATEGAIHVSRFADLDIKAPERLVRMRTRHSADLHLVLRFREETESYEHVLENSAAGLYPLLKKMRDEFGDAPFGIGDLTQATGVSRSTAHRWLDRLGFAGVIQKNGRGDYRLMVKA